MSILTLDSLLAGMLPQTNFYKVWTGTPVVANWYSMWNAPGYPGQANATPWSTGGAQGQFYTCSASQVQGQLYFQNPPSGDTSYLARFTAMSTQPGVLMLADRIWADSLPITTTWTVPVWSGSFPRSQGKGGGDSSGLGVFLGLEAMNALGGGVSSIHVTYINSSGTGDTATGTMQASVTQGTFIPLTLGTRAGNNGVRSVSWFLNGTNHTSGNWGLVAYRPLAMIAINSAPSGTGPLGAAAVDALTSGFPILYPNTVPFLIFIAGNTTTPIISGTMITAQG
jgi:hypothetical protein